jgi:hypothetical protein
MSGQMLRLLLTILALLVLSLPAAAHEQREVGPYEIAVGWRVEPAYVGLMNGPEVFVSRTGEGEDHGHDHDSGPESAHHDSEGLAGVPVDLSVEVSFGGQSVTLPLRPVWGTSGHYVADLIPTMPGDYTFRVFGTIGETAIDETLTSADGLFSTVEPVEDILFPVIEPQDNAQTRIAELEARIAELETIIAELRRE